MNDNPQTCKNSKLMLYVTFVSVALNIFFVGFTTAKLPFLLMPPPSFMSSHMPAPPFGSPGGMMPPPPPFIFMAGALFTQEELQADRPFIDKNFEQMRQLRKTFVEELKNSTLTPEVMMKEHFSQTNQIMDEMRGHLQQKVIGKVTGMSPDERKQFADKLAGND